MSVVWDFEREDRRVVGRGAGDDAGEPDICDLGVSFAVDEAAREAYAGARVAGYIMIAGLLTALACMSLLLWRLL